MDPSSERAYADRPSAAGQSGERMSDLMPGWFNRRDTTEVCEAVRILDLASFPIAFLRSDEFVSPAKPGLNGVTIGRRGRDMELAVPPGYWLARDDGGDLFNWHPDEFGVTWSRMDRPWTPARDRGPTEGGWRGTPPAEGTRRRLILDCLDGSEVHLTGGSGGYLTRQSALAHADAIEAALLDATIGAEEQLAEKRDELVEIHRFLDDLGAPCGPEISSPTVLRRLVALLGKSGSFAIGEGSEWPLPPGEYEIRPVPRQAEVVDGAEKIVSDAAEPDRPDAEILDGDGHSLGGLEVVIGAQDGVPYVSLADLEHVFANLYEDITERQARKQRQAEEKTAAKLAAKRQAEARIDEEHRIDNEDDRPLWKVELDYGLNHVRNAIASWLGALMGVAFYKKKPVTIEAVQLDADNVQEILDWINRNDGQAIPIRNSPANASQLTGSLLIHTLEGDHRAEPLDWVIRGVKGEFYPCKPDIFAATYDPDPDA